MKLIKEYRKNGNPNGNPGTIYKNEYGGEILYITTTATRDGKDYKTLKGAENFMKRRGYVEIA